MRERRASRDAGASTTWAVIAAGIHLFPFRTEKLSPPAPMVLGAQAPGRVGRRPPFRRPGIRSGFLVATTLKAAARGRCPCTRARVVRTLCDGAPRRRSRPAPVDRGGRRRHGRRLQRPRGRLLDSDDPASVHRGRRAGVHTGRGPPDRATRSRSCSTARSSGGIGIGVNAHDYRGTVGYWVAAPARGRGLCTRALRLLSTARARRARAPAARADHRPGQPRVAARGGEGRLPPRGCPARAPSPPGRARPRLGDVLAPTGRASRVRRRSGVRSRCRPARAGAGGAPRAADAS